MKLLVAALLPTQGSILVDGRPLDRSQRALKARLGYLPQSFGLYDELTVYQFLTTCCPEGLRNSRSAIDQVIRPSIWRRSAGPESALSPEASATGGNRPGSAGRARSPHS